MSGTMNNSIGRHALSFIVKSCLIFILLCILQPPQVHPSELLNTIQISSLKNIERAKKEYSLLIEKLNKEDLDYLRIEKIGNIYSVRLGKFTNRHDTEKVNQKVQHFYPSAIILKAYIKDERIIKQYSRTLDNIENKKLTEHSSIHKPETDNEILADNNKNTEKHDDDNLTTGDMYFRDGRMISAAEFYRNALIEYPDNPVSYFKLANALKELRLYDDAIIQMKKAIDLSSVNDTTFRVELGKLYLTAARPGKAKEQFMAAIKIHPGSADIHYYMGVVFMKEGDYETAWFAAKTAQSLGYNSQDLINVLSLLSEEPHRVPEKINEEGIYIRHIIVNTHEEAEAVLHRRAEADFTNNISNHGSTDQTSLSNEFIGHIDPSNVHPKITQALLGREVFEDPIIVETEHGFHIVQRIMPLSLYLEH